MRSAFGRTLGIPRLRGLGAVSTEEEIRLRGLLEPIEIHLEAVRRIIDEAAQQGFDTASALASHDEIASGIDRLDARIGELDTSTVSAWEEEAIRLLHNAEALHDRVRSHLTTEARSTIWKVGLWAAGGVLATAGIVYWLRRRRR